MNHRSNKQEPDCRNVIALCRGVLTDNGATPLYCVLMVGSQQQKLKFALDSGTTHSWVTSIQCTTDAGLNHQRFDFRSSLSYAQVTDPYNPTSISFGPWGTVIASVGSDTVAFVDPDAQNGALRSFPDYKMYLASHYDGQQFTDLIWDGAIGIPVAKPDWADSSELFALMMESKDFPFKNRALRFNYRDRLIQFVDLSPSSAPDSIVVAPVVKNKVLPDLWVAEAGPIQVENESIREKALFCLDTGSSCFKGDPGILEAITRAVTRGGRLPTYIAKENPDFSIYPDLVIHLEGKPIRVKPEHYFEKLASNFYKLGFKDMEGLDGMLLAGSDFLERHAPIFFFGNANQQASIGLTIDPS